MFAHTVSGGFDMRKLFNYKIIMILLIALDIIVLLGTGYSKILDRIPDEMVIFTDSATTYNFGVPVKVDLPKESQEVFLINDSTKDERMVPSGLMEITGKKEGRYAANIKLLGIFNLKDVSVNIIKPVSVYPIGKCAGIYVETDGIMVLGCGEIKNAGQSMESPCKNILKAGDYILKVNHENVDDTIKFKNLVNSSDNDKIILTIRRDGEIIDVSVNRLKCDDGDYRIGLWIRENLQGIGTITYVDADGRFGALGHSISDSSSGKLLEIEGGEIYRPTIRKIIKGQQKNPGEIYGTISYNMEDFLGLIDSNSNKGIFGMIQKTSIDELISESALSEVCLKNDIHTGKASIICNVDSVRREYEIEIEEIDLNSDSYKDMVIKMTDENLLEKTNGIIQGMSGSPIIQDGKIVGAVTHVFVNDPTKGYGIFIENMLEK